MRTDAAWHPETDVLKLRRADTKGEVMLFLALLLQVADADSTGQDAPAADPAIAEATTNRARMKTPPKFIEGPRARIPEAAKAVGAQGEAVVWGIIGTDGRFRSLSIKVSSKSQLLDEAALVAAAASRFSPARDASGQVLAVTANMPFEFSNTKTPEGNGAGVVRYGCAQFILDTDWWAANQPDKEDRFVTFMRGFSISMRAQRERGDTAKRYAVAFRSADFDARMKAATASCRANPDKLLVDFLKPEGDFFREMARQTRRR